jgi:hypothetical protein
MDKRNEKRTEINFNNFKRTYAAAEFMPCSARSDLSGSTSIQASGVTMSNEHQARKMLTAVANPAGGFVFAGEFYNACCCFLAETECHVQQFLHVRI